ncbi:MULTISPECIES: SDR family NAD(P)-dependent oxidoreductase [Sphingobium]|jgi:meso-butanediol dehydrogenase/(S,S)-butanediol dehydrogenase/diacetyl reductase|uniref:3-oxoacyl-[acyl-carrier protein] reductase n=1 Tax=Sphingobium fuliginis (strain ATCC 27551) TaxID=336203 RepID=A0A292ZNV0_SPHSA|nr:MULTISPECIES: SDR family oxidoreductase [Sphingobium]QOT73413.1 SDR family oxidoreductase [Sphingobium fuliginis]RYL98021.1 SDR family oxidoreductase [Sphingobium fuliginis]UXC92729.1 SDR family oxidoreductase [Sphingobium sp. RSMS]WDA34728.1 SDR family oxidoreductase [Sphingobium sp. YC-XJ3]GAY24571.1 3-oxoacyl-[acyl-carrier protein] reductase [Sphingobium fuliginis]
MRLDGRIAVVTGAARGIGRAIARGLAEAGAHVVLTDVQEGEAAEAARAIAGAGGQATAFGLDVSDAAACETLAARLERDVGPVSILVNNAGVIFPGRIDEPGAREKWDRTLAINVGGPFNMCRAFHPQLRATRGSVINLASIRSFVAAPNAAAYAASKGAVMQLTRALAVEWGGEGIRVNAIAPGFIETTLVPDREKTADREAAILARTPLRRQGQPDEIAGTAVYLASDAARYVSGAIIPVDGAYLAG